MFIPEVITDFRNNEQLPLTKIGSNNCTRKLNVKLVKQNSKIGCAKEQALKTPDLMKQSKSH